MGDETETAVVECEWVLSRPLFGRGLVTDTVTPTVMQQGEEQSGRAVADLMVKGFGIQGPDVSGSLQPECRKALQPAGRRTRSFFF
jgi:hypothetical protein